MRGIDPTHLVVEVSPRYWEDAVVDGVVDHDGTLIPLRREDGWYAQIHLASGRIEGWPAGVSADIHYKVCDAGEYFLGDAQGRKLARWRGVYVPHALRGRSKMGDYLVLKVDSAGMIHAWALPEISPNEWEVLDVSRDGT